MQSRRNVSVQVEEDVANLKLGPGKFKYCVSLFCFYLNKYIIYLNNYDLS